MKTSFQDDFDREVERQARENEGITRYAFNRPSTTQIAPATDLPTKAKDLSGQKFNMLTAISYQGVANKWGQSRWLFQCDCGKRVIKASSNVIAGTTKSCGCLGVSSRIRHGMSRSRTYKIYYTMLQRCYSSTHNRFIRYGGAGIIVCDRWRSSYENFLADMGECPIGLSLDRLNPLGNYEPSNCQWANSVEQAMNKKAHWIAYADKVREQTVRECMEIICELLDEDEDYGRASEVKDLLSALLTNKGEQR